MAIIDWEAYTDAWNRHDGAAIASFFLPDGVYEDTTMHVRNEGHEAIRRFVENFAEEFSSDYRFVFVGPPIITDSAYAGEWVVSGTNDRSGPAFPATGKKYEIRGVSIGTIRDGRLNENHDYWDMATFLGQVGLMPTSGGAPAS